MRCPKCGARMSIGAPHSDYAVNQWECHYCGTVVEVTK